MTIPLPFTDAGMAVFPWLMLIGTRSEGWGREGLIAHEAKHQEQMRRDGWWRFVRSYVFDAQARARYEAEALACNVRAAVEAGPFKRSAIFWSYHYAGVSLRQHFGVWWFSDRGGVPDHDEYAEAILRHTERA